MDPYIIRRLWRCFLFEWQRGIAANNLKILEPPCWSHTKSLTTCLPKVVWKSTLLMSKNFGISKETWGRKSGQSSRQPLTLTFLLPFMVMGAVSKTTLSRWSELSYLFHYGKRLQHDALDSASGLWRNPGFGSGRHWTQFSNELPTAWICCLMVWMNLVEPSQVETNLLWQVYVVTGFGIVSVSPFHLLGRHLETCAIYAQLRPKHATLLNCTTTIGMMNPTGMSTICWSGSMLSRVTVPEHVSQLNLAVFFLIGEPFLIFIAWEQMGFTTGI